MAIFKRFHVHQNLTLVICGEPHKNGLVVRDKLNNAFCKLVEALNRSGMGPGLRNKVWGDIVAISSNVPMETYVDDLVRFISERAYPSSVKGYQNQVIYSRQTQDHTFDVFRVGSPEDGNVVGRLWDGDTVIATVCMPSSSDIAEMLPSLHLQAVNTYVDRGEMLDQYEARLLRTFKDLHGLIGDDTSRKVLVRILYEVKHDMFARVGDVNSVGFPKSYDLNIEYHRDRLEQANHAMFYPMAAGAGWLEGSIE